MLRSFVGLCAPDAGGDGSARLEAALSGEGQARLLEVGSLAVAYTGPELPRFEPGRPVCVLDGSVYDAVGMAIPDGRGPEIEDFFADAYARDGEELLPRLRGDFAMLLFDPVAGRGLLVRDQLGGRSAVWHESGGRVLFATEYRPLLQALPRRPEPDRVAVAHWLAVSGMPGDRSLYSGVRRVEAGCAVRLGTGAAVPYRYWSPSPREALAGERPGHAAALRGTLEQAVRRRIGPGERAGVLLSGGLDSGTVAALAARGAGERTAGLAYSATFPGRPSVDESELIERLTSDLGLQSTTIRVHGGSVLEGALTYLERFWVPPVSPNLFFWIPLLKRASEDGTTVLLDGEGGDELFGFSPHLLADRLRRGRLLSAVGLVHRTPGAEGGASRKAVLAYLRRYGLKGAVPYRLHAAIRRLRGPETYAPAWMRPEAAADFTASDDSHSWKRQQGPRWFADMVYRVTRGMGPALAYDHIRRRASLAGLEPRHPLVDVDVIELVMRLPPELAFDAYRSRPLLRDSMAGLLPDAVRLRPTKSNFDAVFHEALTGTDLPAVHALLGRRDAEVGAYVDLTQVRDLIATPPDNPYTRMWWALHVWRLVTAEAWLLQQEDPRAVERVLERPLAKPEIELLPARPLRVAGC